MNKIKEIWKKYFINLFGCFIFLILLCFIIWAIYAGSTEALADHEIALVHDAALVFLTCGILFAAWSQLSGIRKTTNADFILRIDERYASKEIFEARAILHKIHCETEEKGIICNKNFIEYYCSMSQGIEKIRKDKEQAESFTKLLENQKSKYITGTNKE